MRTSTVILIIASIILSAGCAGNGISTITISTLPSATMLWSPSQTATQTLFSTSTTTPKPKTAKTKTPDQCYMKIDAIHIPIPNNRTYAQMAEKIFSEWLSNFKSCPPPSLWRISDYKILHIYVHTIDPRIMIGIFYSLKPAQNGSYFFPGNGGFNEETGWIDGKYTCFELVIAGNKYYLTGGWTMC